MKEHGATAWLVNTGWVGGGYNKGGHRIDITETRGIIDCIRDGSLENVEYETLPVFNLQIPKTVPCMDSSLINPRNNWANPEDWDAEALNLAKKFIANFEQYADTEDTRMLIAAGPQL